MAITFDDMTIKHSLYTWKVPFQCTERACMIFFRFRNSLQKMYYITKSVASFKDQREYDVSTPNLEDQCGEFLKSWIAYLEVKEFPNLIEYYTTIGNGTLLKQKYTTIKECTILKDIEHFMYLAQLYFSDNTPNQILHTMSTLLSWLKIFKHYYWSISCPI